MTKPKPAAMIKDTLLFIFVVIPLAFFGWIFAALVTMVTSVAAVFGFEGKPPGRKKSN